MGGCSDERRDGLAKTIAPFFFDPKVPNRRFGTFGNRSVENPAILRIAGVLGSVAGK